MATNYREFITAFDQAVADQEELYNDAIRLLALKLFNGIVLKTPVDTGRARMNWQLAVNRIPTNEIDSEPDKGSSAKAPAKSTASNRAYEEAQRAVSGNETVDYISITNNMGYIELLEYGWSLQAPIGMVRVTLTEFEKVLRETAKEVAR